jgi:hypothetical protein
MQQSICDAMMDEMGKDVVGLIGLFLILIMQQNIGDTMMDEMGEDDVCLVD